MREEEGPETAEELNHFPFKNFKEFRKAYLEGIISLGGDRSFALQWAQRGVHAPGLLRFQTYFLLSLPYLATLGFIIWLLINRGWFWLFSILALPLGFFLFHPGAALFGILRYGFMLGTIICFVWAILTAKANLLALTIALLTIWFSTSTMYRKAIKALTNACYENEDLLCALWKAKALNVRFYNGDSYWCDWKMENGNRVHYEDEK